jgi:hypothetical protein
LPSRAASSFHSLIDEKRCRRRPVVSRIEVARLVVWNLSQSHLQATVAANGGPVSDKAQGLARSCPNQPGHRDTGVSRLDELACRPDQDVGIPDCPNAMLERPFNTHSDCTRAEIDRSGYGETCRGRKRDVPSGFGHERRHVSRQGTKQRSCSARQVAGCFILVQVSRSFGVVDPRNRGRQEGELRWVGSRR